MAIEFACYECGKRFRTAEKHAGGYTNCPRCQTRLQIPRPAEKVVATTPSQQPVHDDQVEPEVELVKTAAPIHVEDLVDMTAMVDIVFFLLIFFLVTSMNANNTAIPMPVPDPAQGTAPARTVSEVESDNSYCVVKIDRLDVISVDGVEVLNAADLVTKLRNLRNSDARVDKMLVMGAGEATHGALVTVLDSGSEVGMGKVALAVRDDAEGGRSRP